MALPSRIPIIPQLAQSFYKTTDFFIRIRYSCAHGLAPVETQYRFATSIILNLKKFFMRKPCAALCGYVQLQQMCATNIISTCYRLQRYLFDDVIASFIQTFMASKALLLPQFRAAVNA
jgi:hypothetical protein